MMKVIKITLSDSAQLFEWRNNPEVYRYLFNPRPVEKNEHDKWLSNLLQNPKVLFYKVNFEGKDIGTVRFDLNDDLNVAEVGIYLSHKFHGRGLSAEMLTSAEAEALKEKPSLKSIVAKVVPENLASEKMFLKSGYLKKFIQLEKNIK